jgi:hypothetical protein
MFNGQVYSTAKSETITPAACTEDFIKHNNISLRALVCAEAYHKFKELYDFTLITASTDDSQKSLQSMINIQGVSYGNGMKLINQFLQGIDRTTKTDDETKPVLDDSIKTDASDTSNTESAQNKSDTMEAAQ